jgi:hypothetical protein
MANSLYLSTAEEYFSIPLTVTRRKIAGLRDLLVASSRWHPHFVSVLQKYPDLQVADLTFTQPKCDACRISARRSKHIGRLSGLPYEHLGFQVIPVGWEVSFIYNIT